MSEDTRPQRAWWRQARTWLGLLVSLACLVLAFMGIDLAEVGDSLRGTNVTWLLVAMLVATTGTVAKAVRWRVLMGIDAGSDTVAHDRLGRTAKLGLPRLTSILLAGTAMNLALPAPRSGDLARAYLAGEASGTSKSRVLGTVAAEKLLDIVMLAVCFLALIPFMALPAELAARQRPVMGLALFLIVVVVIVMRQRHRLLGLARLFLGWLPGRWGGTLVGSTERAVQGLDALREPRLLLFLLTWSVAIWLLSALVNHCVFLAMGISPGWVDSFFVLVVLQAGIVVPSSPGKVGVFQILCRWALMFLGYSAATGLAYGILLYLVVPVFYMIIGALALLWESWRLRRTPGRSLESLLGQGEESLSGAPNGS